MFEGSEKKLEIVFSKKTNSLRNMPKAFWETVIEACGARVISSLESSQVQTYLLSESSLFVWDHRLVLITCGNTILPRSFLKVLEKFSIQDIEVVFYQRKNEFFPWNQRSYFLKDVYAIEKKIKGESYQFGAFHDHHFLLFHSETRYKPQEKDSTLEILMYDSDLIVDTSQKTIQSLKKGLESVFPQFEVQDHFFEPFGYSLNAVKDSFYYTIHITPQKSFFYISFETNVPECYQNKFIDKILDIFKSRIFDIILFQPSYQEIKKHYNHSEFLRKSFYCQNLKCGYQVSYMTFSPVQNHPKLPWVYEEKDKFI